MSDPTPAPDTTITRALSDAARASLAAAAQAFEAGDIEQRAIGDGVYVLVRT